jgi:tripartite-type tricarboxylate transporter receptor subunit TctC
MIPPGVTRRHLLAYGAAAGLVPRAAAATAPASPQIMVAGPDGSPLDGWAAALAPALARGLAPSVAPGASLRIVNLGGVDGVTGANQFEARAAPDGQTALLVPGEAAIAWLAGDPRVQFDAARWVAVLAGTGGGLVVGRVDPATWTRTRGLQVAGTGPAGPSLAMMLALELLGVSFTPVFGFTTADARAALASGRVQVVLLAGANVPKQFAALSADGGRPLFALGTIDASGEPAPDPLFPGVPDFNQLHLTLRGAAPAGPLYDAWRATAVAAQMTFGLVLPELTPAAAVALWRRAAAQAVGTPMLQSAASQSSLRTLAPQPAVAITEALAASPDALLDLRSWLADRWHYPPA